VDAYTNVGILLNGQNRAKEASDCFCKAITLRPKHPGARRLLALAHCMIGEVDEAVKVLEEWLREDPGDPIAEHMLAACTSRDVPSRASNAFVEKTFDAFAASFEAKLESLSYRAPDRVAAALADSGLVADGRFEILDIGCGTGLCGPLLRPYASRLTGVDLSAGMLALAKEKNIYTDLQQWELTEFCAPVMRSSTLWSPPIRWCISVTWARSAKPPPAHFAAPGCSCLHWNMLSDRTISTTDWNCTVATATAWST
jgi:predicted TPR repeat methyltransferase